MDFSAAAPAMLIDLTDPGALDASLTGAKAANLARARTAGLPVLDGFVLTTRGRPSPSVLADATQARPDPHQAGTTVLVVEVGTVLGPLAERKLRGCLEDASLPGIRGSVVSLERDPGMMSAVGRA